MLTAADDYSIHQIAAPVRFVGPSDRNFYDRYYFNMHGSSDELFMVMGMGQYPNLAVQDAFVVVRRGREHRVVRASQPLVDRMSNRVGPFDIEILEPLHKLRFTVDENEHGLTCDLVWEGAMPAYEEPQHFVRNHGRVMFDSKRFAQTGRWSGTLTIGEETIEVTPDRWQGTRDRSWGIRPVGESEPAGVHAQDPLPFNMWNYAPMLFDDYSILFIVQEDAVGNRQIEEAVKVWADPEREPEHLGRPECVHTFVPGTRYVESAVLSLPDAPGGAIDIKVTPLVGCHIGIGTGYGFDPDWRHGAYQGPELVVQGLVLDTEKDKDRFMGIVDQAARFELGDEVGYGMHEFMFLGPYERYGFESYFDVP